MKVMILLINFIAAFPLLGQWLLEPNSSQINFVTIKNQHIAENHRFKQFSGQVIGDQVLITIKLASVDTNIAIRDQRMRDHLFSVINYPEATYKAQLDSQAITAMKIGSSQRLEVKGEVNLHGFRQSVATEVMIAKLSENTLQVTSVQPMLIRAKDFALVEGINKLQQLAGLNSIAYTVPLNFSLTFIQR